MTDQEVCQWNSGSSVNFNGEEMYISSFLPSNCNTAYPLCIYKQSEPATAMSAVLVGLSLRDTTVVLISCDTCISRWFSSKKPIWQCRSRRKCRFHPWGGKIPWSRKWHLSSSILAWEIPWREEHTVHGVTKNQTGASEHAHKHVVLATNILKLRFHSTFLQTYVGLTARF